MVNGGPARGRRNRLAETGPVFPCARVEVPSMTRSVLPGWQSVVLLLALALAPARGDQLTRAEVARRGKAATALVQLNPATVAGTAFGVQPAGYFVTADRVLGGSPDDAAVTLVLDPGLKTQEALQA